MHEGLNLLLKWVAFPVLYVLDQNWGEAAWIPSRGFSHGFDHTPVEIDRNVLVRLKDAHSSLRFETDSASDNIRDAPVSELDSGARNVLPFREHRRTSRIRRPNGRIYKAHYEIEIVDHEVEDDVDIRSTLLERGYPLTIDI